MVEKGKKTQADEENDMIEESDMIEAKRDIKFIGINL